MGRPLYHSPDEPLLSLSSIMDFPWVKRQDENFKTILISGLQEGRLDGEKARVSFPYPDVQFSETKQQVAYTAGYTIGYSYGHNLAKERRRQWLKEVSAKWEKEKTAQAEAVKAEAARRQTVTMRQVLPIREVPREHNPYVNGGGGAMEENVDQSDQEREETPMTTDDDYELV